MRTPQFIQDLLKKLVLQDDSICLDQRRLLRALIGEEDRTPEIVALHACVTFGAVAIEGVREGMLRTP